MIRRGYPAPRAFQALGWPSAPLTRYEGEENPVANPADRLIRAPFTLTERAALERDRIVDDVIASGTVERVVSSPEFRAAIVGARGCPWRHTLLVLLGLSYRVQGSDRGEQRIRAKG